jgi:hypothetical protein
MENTCLACAQFNAAKGPNVAAYDPLTGALVPLFNPRADSWHEHFLYDGPVLRRQTPVARATIEVLNINEPDRVEHRRLLRLADRWET